MFRVVKSFDVKYLQVLNEKGEVDEKLMPDLSRDQVLELYEWMVLSREFDDKALKLQRSGRLGTIASQLGQEATIVGSSYALRNHDWLVPSFRFNTGMLVKGVKLKQLFDYWGGDERGSRFDDGVNVLPVSIPVSSQTLHAVGLAWGAKLRGDDVVVLVDFGDGGTSEGEFYEALNFSGVFDVPVIFLCQNNQYAISVPREKQSRSETLAQKAIAAGIDCLQVDGNDVFAVFKAVSEAVNNKKPILIECITYRLGDHTTSDDASRYRSEDEVNEWRVRDPIKRLELFMKNKGWWSEKLSEEIKARVKNRVGEAVEEYLSTPRPNKEDIFKFVYAEMPPLLRDQLEND